MDEDGEPVEDAYVELISRRFRSKHFMIPSVARLLTAMAKKRPSGGAWGEAY